jgi:hypothetical protein
MIGVTEISLLFTQKKKKKPLIVSLDKNHITFIILFYLNHPTLKQIKK